MFLIDVDGRKAKTLAKMSFSAMNLTERYDLQEWIVNNPGILGERLLIIQKEFAGFSDTKERLDLLALDEKGNLVVIENKLDDSGKDVVWQALKYVSYCATLTKADIRDIYQSYLGESAQAELMLCEFYDQQDFEDLRLNPVDGDQRIILVSAFFRKEVTSTVLWLRDHNVDITCIKVSLYRHEESLYLDTEQILPIKDAGDYQIKLSARRQEEMVTSVKESDRAKQTLRFWELALPELRRTTGTFTNVSPTKDHWVTGYIGFGGIGLSCVVLRKSVRVELYIDMGDKEKNEKLFHHLQSHQEQIEGQFGAPLYWQELKDKRACRISQSDDRFGLDDENQWNHAIAFMSKRMAALQEVFTPYLKSYFS